MEDQQKIKEVKKILGPLANNFTDEQFKLTLTEVQFLTDSWLDEFEKDLFDGQTVHQLLSQDT